MPQTEQSSGEQPPVHTNADPVIEEVEEEEETCGFCIFMKGGGCKEQFEAWSKCVDSEREADNDFTETCRDTVRPFPYNSIFSDRCSIQYQVHFVDASRKQSEACQPRVVF